MNTILKCSSNPCKNGLCIEDKINSYKCICSHGYTGALCDKLIDPCTSVPCLNGAQCNFTNNALSCNCTAGFFGSRCQVKSFFNIYVKKSFKIHLTISNSLQIMFAHLAHVETEVYASIQETAIK